MASIRLQSIGLVKAKAAEEFKIGDFMAWNFGSKSKVVGIEKKTKSFVTFILSDGGEIYSRRLGKKRLVAIG